MAYFMAMRQTYCRLVIHKTALPPNIKHEVIKMWVMYDSTAAQSLTSGKKYLSVKMLNEYDCKEIKRGQLLR